MMTRTVFIFVLLSGCTVLLSECESTVEPTTTEEPEITVPTFESFCKDLKNKTAQPKKLLYIQCLPLIIGLTTEEKMFETEEVFVPTLLEVPNESEPTAKINVVFEGLTLMTFTVVDNNDFHPDIQVQFTLSWQDDRLKWNPTEWRFPSNIIELKPETHIWAPKFTLKGASALSSLVESVTYLNSKVTYTGNVTATAIGQLTLSKCTADVAAYPNDQMKCCVDVNLLPKGKINTDLSKLTTAWDMTTVSIWSPQNLELKHNRKNDADGASSSLLFCLGAKRNTAALGTELSLPMAVSAIVLMCAQLAGKWKMQVYVKLFAILIQIFAFQNLVPSEALTNATRVPRVYLFYNFTLAVTIFSLFQTMLFWALSRRWFIMPPPHRLTLSMKVVSRFLLGDKLERITQEHAEQLNQEPTKSDYRKEWEVIFNTIHAILSLVIIISYLIGIIVIYTSGD